MDSQLLAINYSDPIWIAIAFLFGWLVRLVGLPPLLGFLVAGFTLSALGAEGGGFLDAMADLGITLLLFSIGLKLKLKSLIQPEVWGVATLHMVSTTVLIAMMGLLLALINLPLLADLNIQTALIVGFALSFSSTVFAVKILDELGATSSRHGSTAIGVLVIQDIIAVAFIAISIGKLPSIWALALIALIPLRFVLYKIIEQVGHNELLVLFGITLALIGADIFELVGIKGDVGALIFGMLLANHPKAKELVKALLGFKELFLVGFFLSVGMMAPLGWTEVIIALILVLFLPFKVALYFGLFNLFRLRASTSWRTSLNLANYSEFGLIVGAISVSSGWLSNEWLTVFSLLLAFSFTLSAPLINIRVDLYQKWRPTLKRFEQQNRLHDEKNIEIPANIKIVLFGMGRMGGSVYDAMRPYYQKNIIGIEVDSKKVEQCQALNKYVIRGDATSPDFWARATNLLNTPEWVLLTLPTHQANINTAKLLKKMNYRGRIAAITKHPDEEAELRALGVEKTFNIYMEAGLGFANDIKIFDADKVKQSDE